MTPLDALLIINLLNSQGIGPLDSSVSTPPFVDVTGDGNITPLDALTVINFLNANGGGGEGESPGGGTGVVGGDSGGGEGEADVHSHAPIASLASKPIARTLEKSHSDILLHAPSLSAFLLTLDVAFIPASTSYEVDRKYHVDRRISPVDTFAETHVKVLDHSTNVKKSIVALSSTCNRQQAVSMPRTDDKLSRPAAEAFADFEFLDLLTRLS